MTDKLRKAYRFATVPEHLIRDMSLSDRAVRLWCLLDRYAGKDDSAFPSRETLSNDLSCSRASVDRAVTELVTGGWLSKERRYKGGVNEYILLIAKVPSDRAKRQVKSQGVITDEDTPPVITGDDTPLLTGDDTPSAPEMTPVVTGAAQKEASGSEHQISETSDGSLRAQSAAAEQPSLVSVPTGGASSTRATGDDPAEVDRLGDAVAQWYWDSLDPKPLVTNAKQRPFIHIRKLTRAAVAAGWTQRQAADALVAIRKPVPTQAEFDQMLRALRDGTHRPNGQRAPQNAHHVDQQDPDRQARANAF